MENHKRYKYWCCIFLLVVVVRKIVAEKTASVPKTTYVKDIVRLSKAAEMLSYMNTAENPCFDFYEFSCGNWMKINPAMELNGKTQTTVFDEMKRAFNRKLIKLLSAQPDSADTIPDSKIKIFFQSCMKAKVNKTELILLLSRYGTMPVLEGDAWNEQSFDWLKSLSAIKRDYGLQILIGVDVGSDMRQGKMNRLFIGQPALKLLSKSFYTEKSGLKYRLAYRAEVAYDLQNNLDIQSDVAWQVAEEIVGFEILLSNGLLPDQTDFNHESLVVETTVDELQQKYAPTIQIKNFFNEILGGVPKGPIYVFMESYIKNFKYVLETTNQRLLANYMFYMFLKEFFLPSVNTDQRRQSLCLHKVQQQFIENLDNMAYRKLNIAATESDLKIIWTALRKSFKSQLYSKALYWMTPAVRDYAESKLSTISLRINSYEKNDFSAQFADINITSYNYVDNMKQIFMMNTKHIFRKINKPVITHENSFYLSTTPFTTYEENTIKIPVILLQPYFLWASNYPMAMKLGTLGFLIARELIHNFDDKGRLYNKEGELKNWWDEATTNAFMIDRECFNEQYPQRFGYSLHSPSIDLQSENVADNGGLKLAHHAFKASKNNKILEYSESFEELSYLNYTDEELFFLSFAQLWCNDVYLSEDHFFANRDHHTLGKFRVNGALCNSEEFSKLYGCEAASAMSPAVYCELF